MKKAKLWGALALLVLALIWVLQNRNPVTTRFLVITVEMPQAALLVLTLLIGVAIGLLVALGTRKQK